jgi:hypothetical protein
VLLGIVENALLERNLGGGADRKGQREMLLQRLDRFHRWILDTRVSSQRGLMLRLFRGTGLYWLFFSSQAVS